MTDYMKEAERLLYAFIDASNPTLMSSDDAKRTLAALLAHIQRGAVPEGWQLVPINHTPEMRAAWDGAPDSEDDDMAFYFGYRAMLAVARDHFRWAAKMAPVHCTPTEHEGRIVYEHTDEPIPNADGFVLYTSAPDQFRNAAKMMAVQPSCLTCGGHGMIGGLLPNGGGYQSDPCPECSDSAPALAEPERRIGPASDDDMVVYQSIADGYSTRAPAPAEVPMPEAVAYGFGNTAITGHTNRLMMVRIDIPGGDQYAGAFWLPLVLADEAHTYGVACRAAGEAAGYARAANWLRASAEKHAAENGYHEPDTGSFVFASREAEEWNNSVLELADEMEAALRGEVKP